MTHGRICSYRAPLTPTRIDAEDVAFTAHDKFHEGCVEAAALAIIATAHGGAPLNVLQLLSAGVNPHAVTRRGVLTFNIITELPKLKLWAKQPTDSALFFEDKQRPFTLVPRVAEQLNLEQQFALRVQIAKQMAAGVAAAHRLGHKWAWHTLAWPGPPAGSSSSCWILGVAPTSHGSCPNWRRRAITLDRAPNGS